MTFEIWGRSPSDMKLREYCEGVDEQKMRTTFEVLKASAIYEELELRQQGTPVPIVRWCRLKIAS